MGRRDEKGRREGREREGSVLRKDDLERMSESMVGVLEGGREDGI